MESKKFRGETAERALPDNEEFWEVQWNFRDAQGSLESLKRYPVLVAGGLFHTL